MASASEHGIASASRMMSGWMVLDQDFLFVVGGFIKTPDQTPLALAFFLF
jgi:hypothetical protein